MKYLLSVSISYDVGSQHDSRGLHTYRKFKEENDLEAIIHARKLLEKYIRGFGMRTDFQMKARLAKSGEPRPHNQVWEIREGW